MLLLFIFYSLSHGLLIFNRGIYWDDWVLLNLPHRAISPFFYQGGFPLTALFHNFFLYLPNEIIFYRCFIFIAYFLPALLLNKILTNIKKIDRNSRFFLIIFYLIFPVNQARVALINSPTAFYHLLFWFGFWLTAKYLKNKQIFFRILALLFFYLSFFINSLIMFYLIVLMYIGYVERKDNRKYLDFLLLPFLFWIMKNVYFKPVGLFKGYNQIVFNQLILSPFLAIKSLYSSFIEIIIKSFATSFAYLYILVPVMIVIFYILKKRITYLPELNLKKNIKFIVLGLFLFIIALVPYYAVGLKPASQDWSSRHQLLIPLGIAFLVYYSGLLISKFKQNILLMIYSLLISIFTITNIKTNLDYLKDWYKQLSIIENIKNNHTIKENRTFLVDDKTLDLNAQNRTYRFYEYSGIFKYGYSEETRFAIRLEDLNNLEDLYPYRSYFKQYYNLTDYQPEDPEYIITIDYGSVKLDTFLLLKLLFYERRQSEIFNTYIAKIVTIKTTKY